MLKTRWPWLLLAAVLLVGFCGWAAVRVRSSDWYVAETKFAQIKEGMTYEDVEDIMGSVAIGHVNCFFSRAFTTWHEGEYAIAVSFLAEGRDWRVNEKSIRRPDTSWERLRAWLGL